MPRKLLVVDDSKSMRSMVTYTLTTADYSVVEAEDGFKALEAVAREKFDAIIMDVNMPGMSGLELLTKLREDPNCRALPILILSTEADAELKQRARAARATGWIIKPFQPEKLVATMKKVCI